MISNYLYFSEETLQDAKYLFGVGSTFDEVKNHFELYKKANLTPVGVYDMIENRVLVTSKEYIKKSIKWH